MPRASAVEEAATSKPTTATNDKIFVIDLAPPFPLSPFATQFSEQLVADENGGGLDLFIFFDLLVHTSCRASPGRHLDSWD
jgi:hypothetical protein